MAEFVGPPADLLPQHVSSQSHGGVDRPQVAYQSNKEFTMEASATLYDHHFTGDALADFGLSADDLVMSGVREDLDNLSTRSSTTEASTVVASNLQTPRPVKQSSNQSSSTSIADGTVMSSLDDDETAVAEALGSVLVSRIMLCVGLSLIVMSIVGGAIIWTMFPAQNTDSETISSGSSGFDQTEDVFSNGGIRGKCPSPPQPSPPLPGKKGVILSIGDSNQTNQQRILSLNANWYYSVEAIQPQNIPTEIEYVPMVPSGKSDPDTSQAFVQLNVGPESKRILGYYEPDGLASDSSFISVEMAVERWSLLEGFNVPLVSPSTTDATGMWMRDFMHEADEKCLRVDWIGIHWFGDVSFQKFKTSMQHIYRLYGRRPLLLTEFGVADWKAERRGFNRFTELDVLAFMKQALPWIEEQDWIAGYAWHGFEASHPAGGASALFDEYGTLTAVGEYYASI